MIRKVLFLISLSLLISSIATEDCLDGNVCDSGSCCVGIEGRYGCCGYPEATCCVDHINCCPHGSTCDLVNHQCVRGGSDFMFLNQYDEPKAMTPSTNKTQILSAKLSITPQQQGDLINGFLDGSELRQYVPDLSDCAANTTSVVTALSQAIDDFVKKNATLEDIADGIQMIGVAIQGLSNATYSCKNLPPSFRLLINFFLKIIDRPADWFKLVTQNIAKNSLSIMWDLVGLDASLNSKKFKDVGKILGEVFKYIFKVEFGQNFLSMFKVEETLSVDPGKALVCGYKVYEVVLKLEPIIAGCVDHPENILALIVSLPGYFKELEVSCSGVFDLEKIQKSIMNKFNNLLFVTKETSLKANSPSISEIIACVQSMRPFITDVYHASLSYKNGDTDQALVQLQQAALDGFTCGMTCYNIIKDITA